MPKYQRLTYEKRLQLSKYAKKDVSQKEIALQLGIHQSTVSRELKRNKGSGPYEAKKAQKVSEIRKRAEKPKRVLTEEMKKEIRIKLKEGWKAEQIEKHLKKEGKQISLKTIYRYANALTLEEQRT